MSVATVEIADEIGAVARLTETVRMAVHDPDLSAGDTAALTESLDSIIARLRAVVPRLQAIVTAADLAPAERPAEDWLREKTAVFDRRYADWMELRAQLVRHHTVPDAGYPQEREWEAKSDELNVRLDDAARLAIVTQAPRSYQVWRKLEILDVTLANEGDRIDWADCRELWMLGGLKADLMVFGIGGNRAA